MIVIKYEVNWVKYVVCIYVIKVVERENKDVNLNVF